MKKLLFSLIFSIFFSILFSDDPIENYDRVIYDAKEFELITPNGI